MNKNALIRYKTDTDKGLMHYVVYNGDVVVMSRYESKKVKHVEEHGTLDITFKINQTVLDTVDVEVIKDSDYVEGVYRYMIETNNAYFEDGTEGLCVLRFKTKSDQ